MGRIVAVTNLKGGIGKTTTVVNVGAGLALKGARVLLVDVDAQGNLAPALGVQPRRTIYEVLVDGSDPARCITSARPNMDLIAADDTLLGAQALIARRPDWSRVLEYTLRPIKQDYDFIFIDVPGSLTVFSVNALWASSDLLVPTTVEHLSIKGLGLLFKQVARLKNSTGSIRLIVPTMFDSRVRQSGKLLEQLQTTYGNLIAPPIRVNVRLSEATSEGQTIYEYDPRSRGALDYAHLVDHLSRLWSFKPEVPSHGALLSHNGGSEPVSLHAPPTVPPDESGPSADAEIANAGRPVIERRVQTEEHTASPVEQPVVTGAGTTLQLTCPHCGRLLRRATLAGYRVIFCDHCKYKQQQLLPGAR